MEGLVNQEKNDQTQRAIHPLLQLRSAGDVRETRMFLESKQSQIPDVNLRLSLGGPYGETTKDKALVRSSSVMGLVAWKRDCNDTLKSFLSLSRSCSLPEQDLQTTKKMAFGEGLTRGGKRMQGLGRDLKWSPELPAAFSCSSSTSETGVTSSNSNSRSSPPTMTNEATQTEEPSTGELRREKRVRLPPKSKDPIQARTEMMLRRMPSVTTTGDGPNGRRIEGFLYKYMKGQVCIVCVCHGDFMTPAEFVRHAGGGDVPNPMRRINVYMNPLTYG